MMKDIPIGEVSDAEYLVNGDDDYVFDKIILIMIIQDYINHDNLRRSKTNISNLQLYAYILDGHDDDDDDF